MKKIIGVDIGNYTFDATNKTIYLAGLPTVNLEQIALVTNVTTGQIIYNFADTTKQATINGNAIVFETSSSGMANTDHLQIIINFSDDLKVDRTEEIITGGVPFFRGPEGEIVTWDNLLATVLGTQSQTTPFGIRNDTAYRTNKISGLLAASGSILGIDCDGMCTVTLQLAGTWAGTISFEACSENFQYQALLGLATNSSAYISSSTGNNIIRFNVAGLKRFQIRFSTYTSGSVNTSLVASAAPFVEPMSTVGSQAQLINQRATTFETNTYDTNLAVAMGTAALYRLGFTLEGDRIVAPTVSPTQPTVYAAPMFANYPQLLPRLRVESGGDKKLPFAQEKDTLEMKVTYQPLYALTEQVLLQLAVLNQNMAKIFGIEVPGFSAREPEVR
jgi:hypothetical protein